MKISLTFEDLAENTKDLNDFLSEKGMSAIYGGQVKEGATDGVEAQNLNKPVYRPYMQIIYPNYCESTYVDHCVRH